MLKATVKIFAILLMIIAFVISYYYVYPVINSNHVLPKNNAGKDSTEIKKLKSVAIQARNFCKKKNYNRERCFLIDMSLPSGKNRFFEYDFINDSVLSAGLVAHGSCNQNFLTDPKFSNEPGCGCTALGKYKVGSKYKGRFGNAYKLYGLDATNSNAFKRNIVLHSYYLVPEKETYPLPICNSLGCAMISNKYIATLEKHIDASRKPLLLWIFE